MRQNTYYRYVCDTIYTVFPVYSSSSISTKGYSLGAARLSAFFSAASNDHTLLVLQLKIVCIYKYFL